MNLKQYIETNTKGSEIYFQAFALASSIVTYCYITSNTSKKLMFCSSEYR